MANLEGRTEACYKAVVSTRVGGMGMIVEKRGKKQEVVAGLGTEDGKRKDTRRRTWGTSQAHTIGGSQVNENMPGQVNTKQAGAQ